MTSVQFDSFGIASLDGRWDFFPGDHALEDLVNLEAQPISVPGLWEAQGHLELDGSAWYLRRFTLADVEGYWTLRFGAVMDVADVYVNGVAVGHHDLPFTPFDLDITSALVAGHNTLAVRVFDPSVDDPEHLRLPHGKQGWMNDVFPSRPSLYMTYGGIWQPVQLRRHGPVVVRDIFVNSDPDDLVVEVELENRTANALSTAVGVRSLGWVGDHETTVPGGGATGLTVHIGPTTAARWSPDQPVLHDVIADAHCGGRSSDVRMARFGLRTVHVEGRDIVVNGEPYRMKSVLVQGFTPDRLYAEGSDEEIEHEVRSAKAMGFNTLRLHIKAFDPRYLDACDKVGILLHCDLPVAEPIAHDEMGATTALARRCVAAITEQVRRDRNHPSIILWSAMNELCLPVPEERRGRRYEEFARTLVAAVDAADGTRPVIENDWMEPDPEHIYASPVVTAHWYGQLHADYFAKIDDACRRWSGMGRPFFITEFGDWGLPQMPELSDPPFWDARAVYAAGLAGTLWPATVGRFVIETQRYQGLSDRLQAEVWRRHDDIGGYCLTELTDVPQELNGLLDLHRRPKPLAVAEVTRGNQVVLPMLDLETLVAAAGEVVHAPVHVANDGIELHGVVLDVRFGDMVDPGTIDELLISGSSPVDRSMVENRVGKAVARIEVGHLPAHRAVAVGAISLVAPDVPGSHDLVMRLSAGGETVSENRYPIHVVDPTPVGATVRLLGTGVTAEALTLVGATPGDEGAVVIAEGGLERAAGEEARRRLAQGGTVVILAQAPEASVHYPVPAVLEPVTTAWGSTVFRFTTDHGALPSLPRRNVLVAEDSTVQATSVVATIGGSPFPDTPVVIAYKPVPGAMAGTIVGSHQAGGGRVVMCQYRLCERVVKGDAAATALLADVLRWAARPRPTMRREVSVKPDGRTLRSYTWSEEPAR